MPATLRSVPNIHVSNVRRIEDGIPLRQDAVILLRKDTIDYGRNVTLVIALPAPRNALRDEIYCSRFAALGWAPFIRRDGVACRRPWNPDDAERSFYDTILDEFEGQLRVNMLLQIARGDYRLITSEEAERRR